MHRPALLILLTVLNAGAWDPDSSRIMAGWDGGPSLKVKVFKAYWIGLTGRRNQIFKENFFDEKDWTSNDSPPRLESGFTKTEEDRLDLYLVIEREIPVHRHFLLNPYIAGGAGHSDMHTDWKTTRNYPPLEDRESKSLSFAAGAMPTFKVFERLRISLRFAVTASRTWGKQSTEFTRGGSPEAYYNRSDFETTEYNYIGTTSLFNTDLILHWVL
jgi:hypothetical protein